MPRVHYTGSFGGNTAGASGLSTTVVGAGLPADVVITSITYTLGITASAYSSSHTWDLHWFSIGGASGSPAAPATSAAMSGTSHTFSGNMYFSQSDASKFDTGTFTLYAKANTSHSATSYMQDFTIDVWFSEYSACTAPTSCSLASTSSTGGSVTLSWSGAKAGLNNDITGYEVQRALSTNGSTLGSWSTLTTTTSTSLSVTPPDTVGYYYAYRVRTLGSAGSDYYSAYKQSTNMLKRAQVTSTACGAPKTCSLAKTMSPGTNVTLAWSGATAGTNNSITGYEIQRAESSNGSTWGSWAALTTTSSTSLSVAPPSTSGNYYKYRVRTRGSAGSSSYSGWKESTNTLRRGHDPLEGFTDDPLIVGETPVKALHMQELQDRVATLRGFYGLSAYSFSSVTAGETSLAGWTAHVLEIRAAIDQISTSHDTWIEIAENKPRADVMEQLRTVVLSL